MHNKCDNCFLASAFTFFISLWCNITLQPNYRYFLKLLN